MKSLTELKKRLTWRWLALIEKPFDRTPNDEELKERLDTMTLGEVIRFALLTHAIEILKRTTGDKE
jgi:hypothetical protein